MLQCHVGRMPMQRALLVIDVQNEYVDGALPIAWPPVQSSLQRITAAMDAATAAEIPVVVVQQAAPATSPIFAAGSRGAALHADVAARSADHLVSKTLPSAFIGTDLADWLTERGVDTIAIAGWMTQNCDESTARDAAHRGFAVEFLADATGTLTLENSAGSIGARQLHESVLITLHSRFAAVLTTADWIAGLHAPVATATGIYGSTKRARAEREGQ